MGKNFISTKSLLLLIVMLIIVSSLQVPVLGDVGNNTDYYDSSGGSSSSSGDGSFIFDILFFLFYSSLPLPIKIGIVAGLFVLFMIFKNTPDKGKFTETFSNNTVGPNVPDNTKKIELEVRKNDPNFSTGKFLGWSEEVFMTIQHAWTKRDWEMVRPFEKEELYRKHQLQLQEYINNGTINVVERVNVNQTFFYKYERDDEYEYLTVYLQARLNDYVIDENTKQVVRGDRNKEYHNKYLLTFMRKTGVLTDSATSNMSTKQCPHCGAPLAITSVGKCEYCDTIVTTGEFDWVLSDLDSIKRDTIL